MLLAAVQHVKETHGDVHAVGQALRPGEEPHHLVHRAHEPLPARHRGLPDRARRHPAQPGLLRRRHASPPSTASSPIRRSRWRNGARRCGSAIPSAATSPACRPTSSGDFAWVQHMVKSMAAEVTGRMAVVLPQGALFRKGAEGGRFARSCWRWTDRGGHRPGAQPVLRHRPRRLHSRAAPEEARQRARRC
jgi:type I restriction enzyme M protein